VTTTDGQAPHEAVSQAPHARREAEAVELVDEAGAPAGSTTVDLAHRPPGLLHRAFSVLLFDGAGRLLLQRRAAGKTRFAMHWANTCCGHPAPGEAPAAAATRRLADELGLGGLTLTEVGVYRYQAADQATQRIENEFDHVLVGTLPADLPPAPDPHEVAELRWVDPDQLAADLAAGGTGRYAPWLVGVLATWRRHHGPSGTAGGSGPSGTAGGSG
jgi:isopentenyl-diphosphate delta-isomerase